MTDNEKRAHDLTLLYIQEEYRLRLTKGITEAGNNSESSVEIPLDYFSKYAEWYPMVLEKVNEYFSN